MSFLKQSDSLSSRLNSNRLLHEAEALNSKVNQYRKTLSLGFLTSKNNPSISSTRSGLSSHPKREYGSLSSLSRSFTPIAIAPETERRGMPQSEASPLKLQYEGQVKSLWADFKASLGKIEELHGSNRSNASSIRQILNEDLFFERESQIGNLIEEVAQLKEGSRVEHQPPSTELLKRVERLRENYETELHKANELKYVNEQLKKEALAHSNLIDEYKEEIALLREDNNDCKGEIERLQKQVLSLERDSNKERSPELDRLHKNYENIQDQLFNSSIQLKQYAEDNTALKGVIDTMRATNDMCYNQSESMQSFDIAITSLKEANGKLEDDLRNEREKLRLSKQSYSKLYEEMQEKVKLISTEWEKKHMDEQRGYERLLLEIDYKNKERIEELLHEHSLVIENKNKEIEHYLKSIDVLQAIEKGSIRIAEHEEKVNEEIEKLKQRNDSEMVFKEEKHKIKLAQLVKEKEDEHKVALEAVNDKMNDVEKEKADLLSDIVQLKEHFTKEKESNDNKHKENIDLKITIELKLKEISELNKVIQDKQNEISINTDNINAKAKEISSLKEQQVVSTETITLKDNEIELNKQEIEAKTNQIVSLEREKTNERTINLNLKKEIQDLVLSTRDLEAKIQAKTDVNSSLAKYLADAINLRDRLVSSLGQMKNELEAMKQFNLQQIFNTKKEIGSCVEVLMSKLLHFNREKNNQMKDMEDRYERALNDQYRINEKLQIDNKALIDLHQQDVYKINKLIGKIKEQEEEINSLKETIAKSKETQKQKEGEIDQLISKAKETDKTNECILNKVKGKFLKIKKSYESKLNDLRSSINSLQQVYINEVNQIANSKCASLQNVIKALKSESLIKANSLQKLQTLTQALTSDVESKGEELSNTKKEYDKLIGLKDKKIKSLQSIISQSFNTYSNGLNSLKTSQKLNDDVRNLIQKAKEDEAYALLNHQD